MREPWALGRARPSYPGARAEWERGGSPREKLSAILTVPSPRRDKLSRHSEPSRCPLGVLVSWGHPDKEPQTRWREPRESVLAVLEPSGGLGVTGRAPSAAAREEPSGLSGSGWPHSHGGPRLLASSPTARPRPPRLPSVWLSLALSPAMLDSGSALLLSDTAHLFQAQPPSKVPGRT